MAKFNPGKLMDEFRKAMLPIVSVDENGKVVWSRPLNNAEKLKYEQIKIAHKKKYNRVERRKEMPSPEKMLETLFWDLENGTTKFLEIYRAAYGKHPKESIED